MTENKNNWKIKRKDGSWVYLKNKEALLIKMDNHVEKELLIKLNRKEKPKLVIIDGVDGVGKTSIVTRIIRQLELQGDKVVFNTFKRRRMDKEEFKEPSREHEWKFRKEVVSEINRRLVTYNNEDWIIVDKSPYSEYFYQKTNEFDRGYISPYGNYLMEREMFRYKEIIDSSIVIFLENDDCWTNYYNREIKKKDGGHNNSYGMLNEKEYRSMVKSFRENQNIYEDTQCYKRIEIRNDEHSWKKVYKTIMEFTKEK
jgi:thymidylate kinase